MKAGHSGRYRLDIMDIKLLPEEVERSCQPGSSVLEYFYRSSLDVIPFKKVVDQVEFKSWQGCVIKMKMINCWLNKDLVRSL